jgi:RNA polymerase sigma-70 factor (ECF subfamily)
MVSFRLDPRLCARVDESDVVQEALAEAVQKLPQYFDERPVPFYPWLRQIAWRQIMRLHEEHLYRQKRSVFKEQHRVAPVSDLSCIELARQLAAKSLGPSTIMRKNERIARVRQAMETLQPNHREVLMLRYVELLTISEIAAVLNISEAAVKMRRVRALEQLRISLGDDESSTES